MNSSSFQVVDNSRSLRQNAASHLSSIDLPSHISNSAENISPPKKHYGKISIVAFVSIAILVLMVKKFRDQPPPPKKYHVTGKAKTTVSFG